MKRTLSKSEIYSLARLSSLFTTGGGAPLDFQNENIDCLPDNAAVELWSLDEFAADDYLVLAHEVGLADAPIIEKKDSVRRMISMLEKLTGKKISGIYASELGQESIVFETAFLAGLPVADFDLAGSRAKPCVDINTLNALGIHDKNFISPAVCLTSDDEIFCFEGSDSEAKNERALRKMTQLSDTKLVFVLDALVRAGDVANTLADNKSFSKAMTFSNVKTVEELQHILNPKYTISGKVEKFSAINAAGFNAYHAVFRTAGGDTLNFVIINELLYVLDSNNQYLYQLPDRMIMIKNDTYPLQGCHSKSLIAGQSITLMVLDAEPAWQTERGAKICRRDRFKDILERIKL